MTARAAGALALAAIPVSFGLGAFAARLALDERPARLRVDFAQPLVVVTAWGGLGWLLGAILIATLLCATLALGAFLIQAGRVKHRLPAALVYGAAVLSLGAAFTWPVVFSSDVYAYAAYGDLARAGIAPYAPPPATFHDPFVAAADWQWGGVFPPCVYGAGFVALSMAAVELVGRNAVANALALLRVAAALAFLGSAYLFSFLLPAERRLHGAAAFALNPLALWAVAEGHNDAFGICAVLAGAVVALRAAALGGLVLGLGPLLKAPGAIAALALAPLVGARAGAGAARRYLGGALAGLAVALAFALRLQLPAATAIAGHGHYVPEASLQALVGIGAGLTAALLVALAGVRLLSMGQAAGLVWLGIGLWLAIPNPYPWYALWILPAAAGGLPGRPAAALWAATILAALRYFPDAVGNIGSDGRTLLALAQLAPLGVLLAAYPRPVSSKKKEAAPA